VLRTQRLELSPLDVRDAEALVTTGRPPGRRMADGYPTDATYVAAGMVVTAAAENRDLGPYTTYQIVRQLDGVVIGDCGFHGTPTDDGAVEIGYNIAASCERRGYASEAVEALIGFALIQHGVKRVRAETTRANQASRRVMEKAGMRLAHADGELLTYEA
jgi:RimJ/RimL family protein N-acetyltransferase